MTCSVRAVPLTAASEPAPSRKHAARTATHFCIGRAYACVSDLSTTRGSVTRLSLGERASPWHATAEQLRSLAVRPAYSPASSRSEETRAAFPSLAARSEAGVRPPAPYAP